MSKIVCYATDIDAENLHLIPIVPIIPIDKKSFSQWLETQSTFHRNILQSHGFTCESSQVCLLLNDDGTTHSVVCAEQADAFQYANLVSKLPAGTYDFKISNSNMKLNVQIAWGMQSYEFSQYKKSTPIKPLCFVEPENLPYITNLLDAIYITRDLINTPTEDMGPDNLAEYARKIAQDCGADFSEIVGDELLGQNFPAVHMVGRASAVAPRLIELNHGDQSHPQVVLIGKGVCFDSGGLDIKPSDQMRLMKKDMGGAAHVLGLAKMIIKAELPIQLRVLIPAVENAISNNAFRPGDIITMRNGKTVEVGNTDAEGRLILADAMALACEDKPDLIIDFATLTGAARMAVGGEIAAMFCNDDQLASDLLTVDDAQYDPMWRMPLFAPYRRLLDSKIADLSSIGSVSIGGAITAALFLQEFIEQDVKWIHFDIMAYNNGARPAHPDGGEAMGLRSTFTFLQNRYENLGSSSV